MKNIEILGNILNRYDILKSIYSINWIFLYFYSFVFLHRRQVILKCIENLPFSLPKCVEKYIYWPWRSYALGSRTVRCKKWEKKNLTQHFFYGELSCGEKSTHGCAVCRSLYKRSVISRDGHSRLSDGIHSRSFPNLTTRV